MQKKILQIGANISMPQHRNTPNSCNQLGLITACRRSVWPGSVLLLPKTRPLLEVNFRSHYVAGSALPNRHDSRYIKAHCTPHSTSFRCLKATEGSCDVYDDVCEMERKRSKRRTLCLHPSQRLSSRMRRQASS